jgi:transcriptional regulator with XRE-family HTH domain
MAKDADLERAPNPVDRHVGLRIRLRRKALGISQERLAESIGLTFQQIQKYERATNRVSASKLWEMARALNTTIGYFFDGLGEPVKNEPVKEERSVAHDFLMTPEGMELATCFTRIRRPRVRRRVIDLVRVMGEGDVGPDAG